MKKILISFCLLFSVIIVSAQSQSDLDKTMKQMQEMIKTMTPEEQEMVKQYTKGLPTSVEEMKNAKLSVQNSGQEANKASDIGKKTTKIIGPEGGEIKSANGKITLKFPTGAVAKKTEISIEEIGNDLETGSGNAFQLLPEGIEFIEPVTLILKYTDEETEGSKEDDLFITTRGKNNELLISLLSDVDTIANTITTEINHFSKWGMCARLKVKLVPEEKTLNKGQSVDLEVQRWEIMPVDIEKKEALLKELYEKEKKYEENSKKEYNEFINSLVSQKKGFKKSEYTPTRDIDALGEKLIVLRKRTSLIVKKIVDGAVNKELELDKIKKELGLPIDDLLTILEVKKTIETTKLSITDWKLNNTKAPVSNSFGTLTPKEFNAKYTAPKIISDKNKNVIVTVTVMGKEESGETYKFKLHSNITLTDEYYLNYTFDGKETNTLQFGVSPTYLKNMQQNTQKGLEAPMSQCFLVDGELIISATSSFMTPENAKKSTIVYLKIKNPVKGQIFVKCDDESSSFRNDTRISVQTGVTGEQFTNSENLRWMVGNTCEGRDNCVPFEFNITEYNPVNGGIVSGSFSGKVYEDKDMAKKCSNSIEHFVSGEFSLAIQITPGDETEIKVPASKPTTTNSSTKPKSKTPPPPPPPLTPEEIAKMDGTPPKAPPPLTPEEIAKMDGTPPKAPPPLTPEEIAKMDGTPPKAPPPLTPEEIAKMDGTPPKAPPPLTPEEIAKMDGTPPKAPPPLTPEEIAKIDGTPPKAPPPLTPAEIAKMDGTNSSSAKSAVNDAVSSAVNGVANSTSTTSASTTGAVNGAINGVINGTNSSSAKSAVNDAVNSAVNGVVNSTSTTSASTTDAVNGAINGVINGTNSSSAKSAVNDAVNSAVNGIVNSTSTTSASSTGAVNGAINGVINGANSSSSKSAATAVNTSSSQQNSKTISLKEGTAGAGTALKSNAGVGNAGSTPKSNEGAAGASTTPKSTTGAGNASTAPKSSAGAGNASSTPKSNEGAAGAAGTGNTIPPKSTTNPYTMPCSAASIAQIPFDCPQRSNMSKYYGNSKAEVKANTEDMYKKLLNIGVLLTEAFKNTNGMIGSWETYVKDINEEGLQTGYLELDIQPLECKSNGEYSKSTGNPTIKIHFYINSFDDRVIKSNRKADGFIATDDKTKDYFDGHLLYLIGEKQYDESFKGFPMYYKGFNNLDQAAVIITKPDIPLFKTISIAQFLELFRKWTTEYNNIWKGEGSSVSNKDIDAFISKNSKEYLEKPCITTWNRSVQSPFLGRNAYADDATMGNPWVYINPEYISKVSPSSMQYIMIKWSYGGGDALTTQALKDFKSKFDLKKLQGMLGQ
jgi:hypothetical protein